MEDRNYIIQVKPSPNRLLEGFKHWCDEKQLSDVKPHYYECNVSSGNPKGCKTEYTNNKLLAFRTSLKVAKMIKELFIYAHDFNEDEIIILNL